MFVVPNVRDHKVQMAPSPSRPFYFHKVKIECPHRPFVFVAIVVVVVVVVVFLAIVLAHSRSSGISIGIVGTCCRSGSCNGICYQSGNRGCGDHSRINSWLLPS